MKKITRLYLTILRYRILSLIHCGKKKLHYKSKYQNYKEIFNKVLMEYDRVASSTPLNTSTASYSFPPSTIEERVARIERFMQDQLPSLLENCSSINSRLTDLEKSVPVALRNLARSRK